MRQWYRRTTMERVRISWRCEMCQVEEHKVVDVAPMEWVDNETFEHDWTFVDRGEGAPAVCSKECAQTFAARLVERAYPVAEVEEIAG